MKKISLNIATNKTKKLIQHLSDLEYVDRQRMSSDGKHYLDEIWKLLGLPTFHEIKTIHSEEEEWVAKHQNKKVTESKENV